MNWLDTSSFSKVATNALKKAQKKIDSMLEIQGEENKNDPINTINETEGNIDSENIWNWSNESNNGPSNQCSEETLNQKSSTSFACSENQDDLPDSTPPNKNYFVLHTPSQSALLSNSPHETEFKLEIDKNSTSHATFTYSVLKIPKESSADCHDLTLNLDDGHAVDQLEVEKQFENYKNDLVTTEMIVKDHLDSILPRIRSNTSSDIEVLSLPATNATTTASLCSSDPGTNGFLGAYALQNEESILLPSSLYNNQRYQSFKSYVGGKGKSSSFIRSTSSSSISISTNFDQFTEQLPFKFPSYKVANNNYIINAQQPNKRAGTAFPALASLHSSSKISSATSFHNDNHNNSYVIKSDGNANHETSPFSHKIEQNFNLVSNISSNGNPVSTNASIIHKNNNNKDNINEESAAPKSNKNYYNLNLKHILELREEQIVKLCRENMEIKEELAKTSEAQKLHENELEDLKKEFTQRISQAEKKLAQAHKERDVMKKQSVVVQPSANPSANTNQPAKSQLTDMKDSIDKHSVVVKDIHINQLNKLLEEKEQIISELRDEGEKLSKQQLAHSSLVKKLRNREKELQGTFDTLNKKYEETNLELNQIREKLTEKENKEFEQNEILEDMSAENILKNERILELESKHIEIVSKCTGLQSNLDAAYKEINALQKVVADKENIIKDMEKGQKIHLDKSIQDIEERLSKEDESKRNQLHQKIKEYQHELGEMVNQHKIRESALLKEISTLKEVLKENELHRAEFNADITLATRPLVSQIDDLKLDLNKYKDKLERLTQEHKNNSDARKFEIDDAGKTVAELKVNLEIQNREFVEKQAENLNLLKTIDDFKHKNQKLQEQFNKRDSEYLNLKIEFDECNREFKTEIFKLKTTIDELKEHSVVRKQLKNGNISSSNIMIRSMPNGKISNTSWNDNQQYGMQNQSGNISSTLLTSSSPTSTILDENEERTRGNSERPHFSRAHNYRNSSTIPDYYRSSSDDEVASNLSPSIRPSKRSGPESILDRSIIDSTVGSSSWLDVEKLEFDVKFKEGLIHKLKVQLAKFQTRIAYMEIELSKSTENGVLLNETNVSVAKVKKELLDLQTKYNALLVMYGEKEEMVQELRLDLEEIKTLYRDQMNILTAHNSNSNNNSLPSLQT